MHMLKTIGILSILFSLAVCFAKDGGENYKLVYPKNIPVNSPFDVSITTSNLYPSADSLEFYIIPGEKITLKKIELKSLFENKSLKFSRSSLKGVSDPVYETIINLKDSALSTGTYFQILMNFNSRSTSNSNIKFYGIYKDGGQVVGLLNSNESNDLEENIITANIRFYKPQKSAGKSVLFENNSYLNFSLQKIQSKNLLTEFWAKLSNPQLDFVQISAKNNSIFQYGLSINHYQMLVMQSADSNISILNPYFISKKSWYHIAVDLSFVNHQISLYCDGKLVAKDEIPAYLTANHMKINFQNSNPDNSFEIDLLRFVNFNNIIEVSSSNENFTNFISDSSSVISQFNFDNPENLNSGSDIMLITSSDLQYVKSDAPIFTRAPELNLTPLNSAYQLEWSGGDFKQANYYVLQKSTGNSSFQNIFTTQADSQYSKTYSFLDGIDNGNDVIYYRIKQVNYDGGVTYSSSVKVGQGMIQPFVVEQNYPNPFNPKTSIMVNLVMDSQLEVTIYNLEGREITRLFKGYLSQGEHTFSFNATDLPSGVYLYKISTPNYSEMKKMILTK
jgi:hypothetical protein